MIKRVEFDEVKRIELNYFPDKEDFLLRPLIENC